MKGDYGHKNGGSVVMHGYIGMLLTVKNNPSELILVSVLDSCECCLDTFWNVQLVIVKLEILLAGNVGSLYSCLIPVPFPRSAMRVTYMLLSNGRSPLLRTHCGPSTPQTDAEVTGEKV